MNRAEMKGVNMNDVSIVSKHDIGYKLNTCYVTQIPEKIMQGNFVFFIEPDFEPWNFPIAFVPITN